jgi:hypothetical protein
MRLLVAVLAMLAAMFLASCHKKAPVLQPTVVTVREPVEVLVPVSVKVQPPAELLAAMRSAFPAFVPPTDPNASSALTPEGERQLLAWLTEAKALLDAWKAWATAP